MFLQHDDETDVDTMLRVEAMGEQELLAKRRVLCELRDRLNTRAAQLLVGLAEGRGGAWEGSGSVGGGGGGAGGGGLEFMDAGGSGGGAGAAGSVYESRTYGEVVSSTGIAGSSSGGDGGGREGVGAARPAQTQEAGDAMAGGGSP